MMQPITILRNALSIQSTLKAYHPLLIEGHSRDDRDPRAVGDQIIYNLRESRKERNITKPYILITQGDPLTERGISAITRHVSAELEMKRCLVTLDEEYDSTHSDIADRQDVIYELKFSQLLSVMNEKTDHFGSTLEEAIERKLALKNAKRAELGKDPMAAWAKTYAMLQEVTKVTMKKICGEVTVAHSTDSIQEYSVTSFYEVGMELNLIDKEDMVAF